MGVGWGGQRQVAPDVLLDLQVILPLVLHFSQPQAGSRQQYIVEHRSGGFPNRS